MTQGKEPFSLDILSGLIILFAIVIAPFFFALFYLLKAFDYVGQAIDSWRKK